MLEGIILQTNGASSAKKLYTVENRDEEEEEEEQEQDEEREAVAVGARASTGMHWPSLRTWC